MTDIEEFDSQLNSDLDRLDKDIKALAKKDFS
jgi:hypothetical protein